MIRLRWVAVLVLLSVWITGGIVVAQSIPPGLIAPVREFEVVARYPHDITAFTEGLLVYDGSLYEGTGLNGRSQLRLVDLDTGKVLRAQDLPAAEFGEGITILDGRIFQLTWQSKIAHVYDLATFDQTGSFSFEGEGWGLTTDGASLIMSNGSDQIVYRDPKTFAVTRAISVRDGDNPIFELNELEYIDGVLWANVWKTSLIARIDPETGNIIDWLDMSALDTEVRTSNPHVDVLNGIALNPESGNVLITGKFWPTLFEIRLRES